jgi:hypothetical protein
VVILTPEDIFFKRERELYSSHYFDMRHLSVKNEGLVPFRGMDAGDLGNYLQDSKKAQEFVSKELCHKDSSTMLPLFMKAYKQEMDKESEIFKRYMEIENRVARVVYDYRAKTS